MKGLFYSLLFITFGMSTISNAAPGDIKRVTVVNEFLARSSTDGTQQGYNDQALYQLCEQGYTLALYVYTKNSNPRTIQCSRGVISYETINWDGRNTMNAVNRVVSEIDRGGRAMVHCWYGVHASNMITSMVLKRRFNVSGDEAANLFIQGVPRGSLGVDRINELANRIRVF